MRPSKAWVDHVTSQTLAGKLPQLDALREVLRRRRASGSPAEEMLSKTVGIELRPRRVREALAWWESVLDTEGEQARDGKWAHPDLLPDVAVLSGRPQAPATDAPALAADGQSDDDEEAMALPDDIDAELAKLLDEAGSAESGPADGSEGSADDSDGTSSDGPASDGSSSDDSPSDDDPRS